MKEYGPLVVCDVSGDVENTHRPDSSGPFFCMACGATDHEPLKKENVD